MTGARIAALVKQNGWVINLVFILMGSYFVSGAVNSVVARSIRVVPSVNDAAAAGSRPTPTSAARVEYQSIAARNLLGAMRENLQPVVEAPPDESGGLDPDATFDPNDLRACTLSASLRGTLVSEEYPEWSLAVLYVNADDKPTAYSINDGSNQIADDATLVEVRAGEIIVRRRDHFERCLAAEDGPPPTRSPRSRSSEPEQSSEDDDGAIQKTGDTEWTVEREYLEKEVLENLSKVATQARIVPSFKNGKPNGFKLFSIKPRSIYSKIGLQNGDVIHKINGYEMNSPDKALEIYQKLKEASSVSVELTRRGQQVNHSYSVK